jgi:hypothetical protein
MIMSAKIFSGAFHMSTVTHIRATLALAIVLSTIGSASANLITNGNFSANANAFTGSPGYVGETGNPTGPTGITGWNWNFSGRFGLNGISTGTSGPITTFGPTSQQTTPDRNWVFLETIEGNDGAAVYQVFNVTPGVEYTVSFEAASRVGQGTNGTVALYDGTFGGLLNSNSQAYGSAAFQPNSFTFTPTQPQATIVLQGQSPSASQAVNFANVSVVAVPEPGALALAGIGIGAVAYGFRRRSHCRM